MKADDDSGAGGMLTRSDTRGSFMTTTTARQKIHVCKIVDSPVGRLRLVASDSGLAAILWEHDDPLRNRLNIGGEQDNHPLLFTPARNLRNLFSGVSTQLGLALVFAG